MLNREQTPLNQAAPPPVTNPRIQSRKVKYTTAWMYFGLILCLCIAWWFPVKMMLQHMVYPAVKPETKRNAQVFAALAYSGVSGKTNEVSPARFREHLKALIRHGYVPLTLSDIRQFYTESKPLPAKGVLLTFDHGRKTSYFECHSTISKAGWNAVMFLWLRPIEQNDEFVLRWPYLENMVRSKTWEIGAQSYDGFARIAATADGRLGNFMTTAQWLTGEQRFESIDEFQARLAADHQRCIDGIKAGVGVTPIAYAYPYGDFGQYQSRALVTRSVNAALVRKYYGLGFTAGNFAINTRYSDSQRLNRLNVSPEWTGEELVKFLDRAWPDSKPAMLSEETRKPSAWILDWGRITPTNGGMVLSTTPEATGAKMWLAGSDLSQDVSMRVKFHLQQGQMGMYLHATPDEDSFVYVGIDARGDVWLREKEKDRELEADEEGVTDNVKIWLRQGFSGQERFTLSSSKVWLEPGQDHVVDLVARGKLLFAMLDGKQLFRTQMTSLRGLPRPGMLGISIWDPRPGNASVKILGVDLQELSSSVATWPFTEYDELDVIKWIHHNASRLSGISPPWIRISPLNELQTASWNPKLFRLLSRTYDLKLIPELMLQEESGIDQLPPAELADKAAKASFDGLFLNLGSLHKTSFASLSAWIKQCQAALKNKGLSMCVQLPATLETTLAAQSMLAIVPGAALVSSDEGGLATNTAVLKTATVLKKEIVPKPKPGENAPFYYDLPALATLDQAPEKETRLFQLQKEGQSAYAVGNYTKALTIWNQCYAIELDNARVLMLIGDAWQRLGNNTNAVNFYDQSLVINPANINLAIRRAKLLNICGRSDEARETLNLYSRLFPDNADILLAQAEWLSLHNRRKDARDLTRHVLSRDPDNVNALMLLHSLLDQPSERYANMRQLLAIGSQPALQFEFGEALLKNDSLALPESHQLNSFLAHVASSAKDDSLRALYQKLTPLSLPIVETFDNGILSPAWNVLGGHYTGEKGWIRIKTFQGRSETNLRLYGTDGMHNGYLEADLNELIGYFWLCARRTADHMVRFGFDQSGDTVLLQVWQDGHLVNRNQKPWRKPPRPVRVRLEVQGDGAMGYLDGKPMFGAPIQIPFEMGGGYWAVSIYDPMPGLAKATIQRLAAAPLPVHIASLPAEIKDQKPEDFLRQLFAMPYKFSIMAPRWFRQNPDGSIIHQIGADEMIVRIFALYHRMRLLPMVEMRTPEISGKLLVKTAKDNHVQGLILLFPEMPPQEWFEQMERDLETSPMDIIAVVPDKQNQVAYVRNVSLGYSVFPESDQVRVVQLEYFGNDGGEETSPDDDSLLWL
ncbi:MAG: polysaccharide deacetylase family protein [Kiritimatiellae bacterium]|nr:polysaccharide deacetylase family protein [Kiritimatiellia bacterium]